VPGKARAVGDTFEPVVLPDHPSSAERYTALSVTPLDAFSLSEVQDHGARVRLLSEVVT
jgi:hypothetical protein